jgi:hypothetical protein
VTREGGGTRGAARASRARDLAPGLAWLRRRRVVSTA